MGGKSIMYRSPGGASSDAKDKVLRFEKESLGRLTRNITKDWTRKMPREKGGRGNRF